MKVAAARSPISSRLAVAVLGLSLAASTVAQRPDADAADDPPPRIHGRIFDMFGDGVPAAEVIVHPTGAPHVVLARCRTDGLGAFQLPGVPDDQRIAVRARARGFAIGSCPVLHREAGVRLCLPEAVTVRGKLRGADGQPVIGVVVRGSVWRAESCIDEFVATGADGGFTFRGLSCGNATFTAAVPGQGICSADRKLVGDADVALQVGPSVDRDTNLTVTVTGLPFEKLAEARVQLSIHKEATLLPPPHCSAPLDPFGVAVLSDLPAATYVLQVHCPGVRVYPSTYELGARFRTENVEFVAEGVVASSAKVAIDVRDPDDRPVAGVALRLAAPDVVTRGVTAADGRAEIASPVASGNWLWLELADPRWAIGGGGSSGDRGMRMMFKRGVPMRVGVVPAGEVRGALRSSDGRPAGAANVALWTVSEGELEHRVGVTSSDADGSYRFGRLPRIPSELRVVVNDLVGSADVSGFRVGQAGHVVDVGTTKVHDVATIRGVLRDAQGRPLPGMHVWLGGPSSSNVHGLEPEAVVTDSRGRYGFPAVPPGEVRLYVNWGVKPTRDALAVLQVRPGLRLVRDLVF